MKKDKKLPTPHKVAISCKNCDNEKVVDHYICDHCMHQYCEKCHPGSGNLCINCDQELA